MNTVLQIILIYTVISAAPIQKRTAIAAVKSEALKMTKERKERESVYDSHVTLIDTIGPLIASLHKKTDKNSKDIEEIKTMLKRLEN